MPSMQIRWSRLALFAGALLVAGAAAAQEAGTARLEQYRAAAGEAVQSFRLFGRVNRWEALDTRTVALWTRPDEGYLLTLDGPCRDLDHAVEIRIGDRRGRVHAGMDSITVIDGAAGFPCRIEAIHRLDTGALADDQDSGGT